MARQQQAELSQPGELPELLTVSNVCELLHLGVQAITKMYRLCQFPAPLWVRGKRFWRRQVVRDYLDDLQRRCEAKQAAELEHHRRTYDAWTRSTEESCATKQARRTGKAKPKPDCTRKPTPEARKAGQQRRRMI